MARKLNEEKYTERRNEILDAALKLIYTKGYEQMTIQDLLDALQISKGAFYHYFDSKGAVLEAMVERMIVDEALPLLAPIVRDPNLTALEKLHFYFNNAVRWKTEQKTFMLQLLSVWLNDDNLVVRQKLLDMTLKQITPLLTEIIEQGVEEGVFSTPYPGQICHVLIYVMQALSEKIVELLITVRIEHHDVDLEKEIFAYLGTLNDTTERILGAEKGSIVLLDPQVLKEWFV